MGAVAALALTAQAQALPDGWYLGLEGGGNWVQDWDFDSVTAVGTSAGSVAFDNGWAVLATVGYGRGNWAAEFETGFRRNDSDEVTVDNVIDFYDDARLNETTFMANIKYNYPVAQKLTLSVGAGLGADFAELRVRDGATVAEDEDWNLAYQGIVSLGYAVGQRSELFASYRYFRTTAADFDLTPALGAIHRDTTMDTVWRNELAMNNIERLLLLVGETTGAGTHPMDPRIQAVLERIATSPADDHSVPRLARSISLSPSRFAHLFKTETGRTPQRFVSEVRLREAATLVAMTTMPIADVATAVGYASAFHFSSAFRARHGVSPRTYRAGRARPITADA